jgi:hypothetical protein
MSSQELHARRLRLAEAILQAEADVQRSLFDDSNNVEMKREHIGAVFAEYARVLKAKQNTRADQKT